MENTCSNSQLINHNFVRNWKKVPSWKFTQLRMCLKVWKDFPRYHRTNRKQIISFHTSSAVTTHSMRKTRSKIVNYYLVDCGWEKRKQIKFLKALESEIKRDITLIESLLCWHYRNYEISPFLPERAQEEFNRSWIDLSSGSLSLNDCVDSSVCKILILWFFLLISGVCRWRVKSKKYFKKFDSKWKFKKSSKFG